MKRRAKIARWIVAIIVVALSAFVNIEQATAQYYSWGSDAPNLKWRTLKTDEFKIIYPDTTDAIARRTLYLLDQVKDNIGFGYRYPTPLNMPIVMHAENFASNGLVMFMPKRVDLLTTPATDSYSMPWMKQLVSHETRHMVQYNNVNQGMIKVLSRIFGNQGSLIGMLFFPLDILEGDAVFAETSMSTFGRGLQPSFTMGFRAMGRDILKRSNHDWLYCGSYRGYIPDHYQLGYQLVTYTYTKYGKNIWDDVVNFSVRRPYLLVANKRALKKFYNTSRYEILNDTFEDLLDFWESLPPRENTTQQIVATDSANFTKYAFPTATKSGEIVALKSDYDLPQRLVMLDAKSGEEQRIAYTGSVSTRQTIGDKRVWWSEYRRSKLFDQRVFSQLCYLDLTESNNGKVKSKAKSVAKLRNVLYPTAMGNSDDHIAYVEYAPNGQYTIVEAKVKESEKENPLRKASQMEEISRTPIKYPTEVHGLAWDNKTNEIYFIATDNSGMWLGKRDTKAKDGFKQLRKGAYITISDLSAKDGVLYFGSIESGYDELHSYEIKSGVERRISQSTYGSFDPSTPITIDGEEYTIATTYDKYGYHIARQKMGEIKSIVKPANTPQSVVNPERKMLDLINIDKIDFTPADSIKQATDIKSRRYSKPGGAFDIHSWFPLYVNLYEVLEESILDINLGATIVSQNLLSNTDAFAAYGYSFGQGHIVSAGANYNALGVKLGFKVKYGGNQLKFDPFRTYNGNLKRYLSLSSSAYLPIYFQQGYRSRQLAFSASWSYTNSLVANLDELSIDPESGYVENADAIGHDKGLHKMSFGVYFSQAARKAVRDLESPLSYSIGVSYATAPINDNFSSMARVSASLTTRGFRPHNAISLSACYQTSFGGYRYDDAKLLSFSSFGLIPAGYTSADVINNNYKAAAINYSFPVWYPDGGIDSIIFFRQITLNAGFNIAHFTNPNSAIYRGYDELIYSYGGGIGIEFVPFRMTDSGTMTLNMSLYNRKSGGLTFLMGFDIPL